MPDENRQAKIEDICRLYLEATERTDAGERVMSTDEMTGVQALERLHTGLPMSPGHVERREFDYKRHGTLSFINSFNVGTGTMDMTSCGQTRNEADFLAHIQRTVESDPTVKRWHFVMDNLNTHCSTSLVCFVAEQSGYKGELGIHGKKGILCSMKSRVAFLSDPDHKIVLHYTPKHASWMNQVEIWFSILVRKVLRRGNFTSTDDLKNKVLAFIEYFNQTLAKPFRWTYQGKVLTV